MCTTATWERERFRRLQVTRTGPRFARRGASCLVASNAFEAASVATDAVRRAASVRMEAQATAGELQREVAAPGERDRGHGDRKSGSLDATPKPTDLGVTNSGSSRWQQVASMPPAVPAGHVEETRAARSEVRTSGLPDS